MMQPVVTLILSLMLLPWGAVQAFNPVSVLTGRRGAGDQTPSVTQRVEKRVQALQELKEKTRVQLGEVRVLSESVSTHISSMKRVPADAFDRAQKWQAKKVSLLNQQHTVLIEWEEVLQKIVRAIDETVTALQEEISRGATCGLRDDMGGGQAKALCSFEDVIDAEQHVVETQGRLEDVERMRGVLQEDLAQRKRTLHTLEDEYEAKKQEQIQFAAGTFGGAGLDSFSPMQQGEAIDLSERLAFFKKELAGAQVRALECSLEHLEAMTTRLKMELGEFKKAFVRVKKSAQVPAEYVAETERALNQKRHLSIAERERINENIRVVSGFEMRLQKQIKAFQQELQISPAELGTIRTLNKEPKTVHEWKAYATMLALLVDESLYRIEHELLATRIELEKAQLRRDELEVATIKSWHRMTMATAAFKSEADVEQEIKAYQVAKTELEAQFSSLTRARDAAINSVHEFNVNFDKLRNLAEDLAKQQHTIFKEQPGEYLAVIKLFENVEEKVRRRFDWVSRLIETYSKTLSSVQGSLKKVEGVMHELTSKSFWQRSESSLALSDFKSFIPDLKRFFISFFMTAQSFFSIEQGMQLLSAVYEFLQEPLQLLMFLVNIVLIVTLYFILKGYLPSIAAYINSVAQGYVVVHSVCVTLAVLLASIARHLLSMYIWTLLFILIQSRIIDQPFLAQLFYLGTIPYALWLVHSMLSQWRESNREKRYFFISEPFEARFFGITSLFLGLVVVIASIRQAFIWGGFQQSPVPSILLAVLFLLGQLAFIALVGRAQILALLRTDTPLWEWIYEHVNRYYYIVWGFVIAIIVMMNPYVGYGRQVSYIVSRFILTVALIPLLSWIHGSVKHISLDLFFYYADRDVLKERFATGRFWYGIFIISSLVFFLAAGLYVGVHLWGINLTIRDMISWLHYPFYTPVDDSGRLIQVTALSVLHIVLYLIGGFVVAYCVNTFVLSRVLDPVIVESGVQNTVLTLMRYIIITVAVLMGMTSAGLEGLTTKIAILMTAIGFAVQNVISDFVSYFILLVQRPVKVGDFIRVLDPLSGDENVSLMGFVRSITPRSIVVRKRNSTTVIIPNSRVVKNPVMNWSYTRGFFAFDDIRISVPYSSDPVLVRQTLLEVLDKNPNILKNPSPIVRLDDFVDNGYSFLVRAFLTSNKIGEQWDIASDVRLQLVRALREQHIEVASPVRTVRVLPSDKVVFPTNSARPEEKQ